MQMKGWKNNNDPWEPLSDEGNSASGLSQEEESKINVNIPSCPQNPLHTMIDSQQYIQTLERRLEQLKKKKENPSSKDIITSLALFQDDQMRNYVNSDTSSFSMQDINESDRNITSSYMKRKLFPELQAVNAIELVELVKDDSVGKEFELTELEKQSNSGSKESRNSGSEESRNSGSEEPRKSGSEEPREEIAEVGNAENSESQDNDSLPNDEQSN